MKKSAAWKSAKSHRSHGAGDFRRRSRHPSPPDHENNLFGDGNDGEKENLATASDVRDQAIKPASEELEPVSLRTRSKLVMDGGKVEHAPDDSHPDEVEHETDPASRHTIAILEIQNLSIAVSTCGTLRYLNYLYSCVRTQEVYICNTCF